MSVASSVAAQLFEAAQEVSSRGVSFALDKQRKVTRQSRESDNFQITLIFEF